MSDEHQFELGSRWQQRETIDLEEGSYAEFYEDQRFVIESRFVDVDRGTTLYWLKDTDTAQTELVSEESLAKYYIQVDGERELNCSDEPP